MRLFRLLLSFAIALLSGIGALCVMMLLLGIVTALAPGWTPLADAAFRDRDCVARPALLQGTENVDQVLGDDWNCRGENLAVGSSAQAFSLNFLEFLEDGETAGLVGATGKSAQQEAFEALLKADAKSYVVVFVHGWRNNADRDNNDVRKFRILLSYAAAFVNQRCAAADVAYCGMQVRGLFIGWRGATFREWAPEPFASLFAASTFMGRKVVSDPGRLEESSDTPHGLPIGVANALRSLDASLSRRDNAGNGPDRMLVMGHSLGGNILLQGFKPDVIAAIGQYKAGNILPAPIGDLLLLINPASAASDWIEMVEPVRDRFPELPATYRWTSDSLHFFPRQQPPRVMALTATCPFADRRFTSWTNYWGEFFGQFGSALIGRADPKCDWVTGFALPLAQIALNDGRAYGDVAAGQLVPMDICTRPNEVSCDKIWPPVIVGVTHGLEVNRSADPTSLANSAIPKSNGCAVSSPWLLAAREAAGTTGWDQGEVPVQFSHGGSIYRSRNLIQTDPITPGNDPFWNVAAHANAIEEHGGFVSYQVWCAINQFVLDDPSARFTS